jgi:uncharacterized repeat protein (TIGR03803 family)
MHTKGHPRNSLFGMNWNPANVTLVIMLTLLFLIFLLLFLTLTAQPAQGQTFSIIHNFTGGVDGENPYAGLTMDVAGNLYGTTCGADCVAGTGTVFRLSRKSSGWIFTPLYTFHGGNDGAGPAARVIIGPDGSLYGTTYEGGGSGCGGSGCGTVFNLRPPANVSPNMMGGWTETVLYRFQGGSDGAGPALGDLIFDQSGNIYGTTQNGGASNVGTVFQLTPSAGGWVENVLHAFALDGDDGAYPEAGVQIDSAGNLYGTTSGGYGTVFELTPSASGWTETILHYFTGQSDGASPVGGVTLGGFGGPEVTTSVGGTSGGGTALVINNPQFLYSFPYNNYEFPTPGPWASLVNGPIGPSGTTYADGAHQSGSVFYMEGCAGWDANTLHDFTGGLDGAHPIGVLLFDANGNIFGTTAYGGGYGFGVVFEITGAENLQTGSAESSNCTKDR